MTKDEIKQTASAAERLSKNEDFKLIMDRLEQDLFNAYRRVTLGDDETLTKVHMLSHGVERVKKQIAIYINTANLEAQKDAFNDEYSIEN